MEEFWVAVLVVAVAVVGVLALLALRRLTVARPADAKDE